MDPLSQMAIEFIIEILQKVFWQICDYIMSHICTYNDTSATVVGEIIIIILHLRERVWFYKVWIMSS